MAPKRPINNPVYNGSGDMVFLRKISARDFVRGVGSPYLGNEGFSELGSPVVTAYRLASLPKLVPHVIANRAKEKVSGINTCSNVALVKNLKSNRNRPVVNLPRNPVAIYRSSDGATLHDYSVAGAKFPACPNPARRRFCDVSPKSFLNGNDLSFKYAGWHDSFYHAKQGTKPC